MSDDNGMELEQYKAKLRRQEQEWEAKARRQEQNWQARHDTMLHRALSEESGRAT